MTHISGAYNSFTRVKIAGDCFEASYSSLGFSPLQSSNILHHAVFARLRQLPDPTNTPDFTEISLIPNMNRAENSTPATWNDSTSETEVVAFPFHLYFCSNSRQTLQAAYCPPLDDALFYAIASEYELPRDRETLTAILDRLKAGAIEQENTDFDPSGTGGPAHGRDVTDLSRSNQDDTVSNGVTSITTSLSDLRWKDSECLGQSLESSSLDGKTAWLQNVFPGVHQRELASILESHEGSLDKATDELLNLSFINQGYDEQLREDVPVLKGIEAFAEEAQMNRKRRKKRKTRTNESSRVGSASSFRHETEYTPSNVWSTMAEDVDFICSRTNLQPQAARSIYHANGARLTTTIRALAIREGAAYEGLTEVDPIVEVQIAEFQNQFEHVPRSQMYGLLKLARNIPSAAHELLEVMTAPREVQEPRKLQGVVQYAPLDLKENQLPRSPSTSTRTTVKNGVGRGTAANHRLAANQSFEQAAAAYRRSKSNRLYGGVAAYYAEVGHDRAKAAQELQAAEADLTVARQSSSNMLDLHGVKVQDAIRIASVKTQAWWDGLGDVKYAPAGGGPARDRFRIVTGIGSHSKNHAPRIGPAVSKMLMREGWRIEIGHGELFVTGKSLN
ncbi:uncharacterized protein Z518_03739 [Rhinocladiella mackenziei CBS 650.93]|uniref:Smr domain-containing protein n=1 Tax=Rhinocladiella mackenziei CBS 650.93 TaxID=1442369 RepID=A0A0D2FUI5_9EURO|nr:uncharacterized protein Z518_03739 [Rhinocladiella mackenziei CBS 650.93]KIX05767.1 hypothetical protein Z518_03739 [Rhinocladiella mackenziei CBS 650.93]